MQAHEFSVITPLQHAGPKGNQEAAVSATSASTAAPAWLPLHGPDPRSRQGPCSILLAARDAQAAAAVALLTPAAALTAPLPLPQPVAAPPGSTHRHHSLQKSPPPARLHPASPPTHTPTLSRLDACCSRPHHGRAQRLVTDALPPIAAAALCWPSRLCHFPGVGPGEDDS